MADQRRPFAGLGHQTDADQRLEMVRQGRRCDVEPILQLADRHSLLPRPHQRAVDAQSGRITEGLQTGSGVIELHASNVARGEDLSTVFPERWK